MSSSSSAAISVTYPVPLERLYRADHKLRAIVLEKEHFALSSEEERQLCRLEAKNRDFNAQLEEFSPERMRKNRTAFRSAAVANPTLENLVVWASYGDEMESARRAQAAYGILIEALGAFVEREVYPVLKPLLMRVDDVIAAHLDRHVESERACAVGYGIEFLYRPPVTARSPESARRNVPGAVIVLSQPGGDPLRPGVVLPAPHDQKIVLDPRNINWLGDRPHVSAVTAALESVQFIHGNLLKKYDRPHVGGFNVSTELKGIVEFSS